MKQEHFYVEVGQRIKRARKQKDLTQETLARRLSMTRASIVNIENARQRFLAHTLLDIALALDIPLTELLPESFSDIQSTGEKKLPDVSSDAQDWIMKTIRESEDK